MAEKYLDYDVSDIRFWEREYEFLTINPSGCLPVLFDEKLKVCEAYPIVEYLDEAYPKISLVGGLVEEKAEVRRLINWFCNKFFNEVMQYLYIEKVIKRVSQKGCPDTNLIRAGKKNLEYHMQYLEYVLTQHNWLAGSYFSWADCFAASQLSVLDYMGDVKWDSFPETKSWYSKIKSRPSFRALLQDTLPGMMPSIHYANLDF